MSEWPDEVMKVLGALRKGKLEPLFTMGILEEEAAASNLGSGSFLLYLESALLRSDASVDFNLGFVQEELAELGYEEDSQARLMALETLADLRERYIAAGKLAEQAAACGICPEAKDYGLQIAESIAWSDLPLLTSPDRESFLRARAVILQSAVAPLMAALGVRSVSFLDGEVRGATGSTVPSAEAFPAYDDWSVHRAAKNILVEVPEDEPT